MNTLIICTDNNIAQNIKEKLILSETNWNEIWKEFEVFKNKKTVLVSSNDNTNTLKKAILFGYSEYSPEIIVFLGYGKAVSNDIIDWDIILPNVFFNFDEKIISTELDNNNKDSFLWKPIFIENYNLQKDYDFKNFGLIIWWISVSCNSLDYHEESREKLRIAYEADIYDKNSYSFIEEVSKMNLLNKSYVILWIKNSTHDNYLNHIASIMNFLLENKTGDLMIDESDEDF